MVYIESGCLEVYGGPKVVVAGQLVWIDEDMRWKGVESMKRTRRGKRGKREASAEGGMKTR